ncbi:hypothetical protein FRC07_001138 [Ceratobasidium sp. 392]|nr:hypothetical protein FRC07_001138 [Ceratobasidium sp. 392]
MVTCTKILTLLVGGYGSTISRVHFDPSSKDLSVLGSFDSGPSPSWVSTHPLNNSVLFATNEEDEGRVISFITNRTDGAAHKVSSSSSLGKGPAYLAGLFGVRQVAVFNYDSGNGAFIPLKDDLLTLDEEHAQKITFDAAVSHPHQAVEVRDEVLVPDLGAGKVWRLKQQPSDTPTPNWQVSGFVEQPAGSGPRHIAVDNGILYTLHETTSTLSSQTLPALDSGLAPQTISTLSILPDGANQTAFNAAELVLDKRRGLLYASNRNVATPADPQGDSIAIFSYDPTGNLNLVNQFFTGLNQIRALAHGGPYKQYIAAAGQTGGGLAVFEKVDNTLVERARLPAGAIVEPASIAWLYLNVCVPS